MMSGPDLARSWAIGGIFIRGRSRRSDRLKQGAKPPTFVSTRFQDVGRYSARMGKDSRKIAPIGTVPKAKTVKEIARPRALSNSRQERAPSPVHIPGLCALVRHLLARLSVDVARARLHAPAGAPRDRRLPTGTVVDPLRR